MPCYQGYAKKAFPPPHSWNHLTSVTNQSIQPASRIAGRGLFNSLLLDIVETEIYPGGAEVVDLLIAHAYKCRGGKTFFMYPLVASCPGR
jgi:hypothetical protein